MVIDIMSNDNENNGLSDKRRRFVHEYCIDQNITQAARRAGYSGKSARITGGRLMKNVAVRAEIDTILQKNCESADLTSNRIIKEEKCIAFADIRQIVNKNNEPIPLADLPDEIARAIASLKITQLYGGEGEQIGNVYEYKFNDKGRSLERLGKHKGLYMDRVQVEFLGFQEIVMDIIGECDPDAREKILKRLAETSELAQRNN